jgi:hypothetical protein
MKGISTQALTLKQRRYLSGTTVTETDGMRYIANIENSHRQHLDQTEIVRLLVPHRASVEQRATNGFGLTRRMQERIVTDA